MTQEVWTTSDTHFFHSNILKYQPQRPWADRDEMTEGLIQNWNSVVKPNDIIYHIGDFAFGGPNKIIEVLKRLNGHKHLILGNHDRVMERTEVRSMFASVNYYKRINIHGHVFIMFHFPIFEWDMAHHGSMHVHGHIHSNRVYGRSMDVGIDSGNNCTPYNIDDIILKLKNEPIKSEYHTPREGEA